MPSRSAGGKELKLAGVFVSFVSPIFWVDLDFSHDGEEVKRIFGQVHQDLYHDHFGRQLAKFDWTPCFETVTKQHVFSNQAASPPDMYKKNFFPKKTITKQIRISRFTPFPLATFEIYWSPIFGQLCTASCFGPVFQETDRMVLRANSEALPWEPVPEGLDLPVFKWIESHININVIWWWYQMLGFKLYICMIGSNMI